jgi:hypothetical protein
MAEDVNQPAREPLEGGREEPDLLPEHRQSAEGSPDQHEPERLPELRVEDVRGMLERKRGGGLAVPPSTYASRFRALTGALVGLGIGAALAAGIALFGRGFEPGPAWSSWKPTKQGNVGAEQIAKHVGPSYKLPTGDQLVLVRGGPLRVDLLPGTPVHIAVAGDGPAPISEVKGSTVQYQLCGLGEKCAIDKGKPSVERFLLLRREALELALYSFRYLKGLDNVVVFLPPSPGEEPRNALMFHRNQLKPALERPLAASLPAPPPTVNSVEKSPEAGLVKRMTGRNLFLYSFTQDQGLGVLLVLNRRAPE